MRRAEFRLTVLPALAVLLGIAGWLQYPWIKQASDAVEERTRNGLRIALARVKEHFDSEIRAASMWLMPGLRFTGREPRFPGAQPVWQIAPRSKLIRQFLRISQGDQGPVVYDAETLAPVNLLSNAGFAGEARRLLQTVQPPGPAAFDGRPLAGTVSIWRTPAIQLEAGPVLFGGLPPLHAPMEIRAVLLDEQYMVDRLLPDLIHETMGDGRGDRYQWCLAIPGKSERILAGPARVLARRAEASVAILASGLMFGSASTALSGRSSFTSWSGSTHGSSDRVRDGAPDPDAGLWQLSIYAADAPLFSNFRQWNLLMSGTVLLALFAALCLLTIYMDRLRSLARARSEIVMAISHDLRTPITSIRVAADSMIQGLVNGPEQLKRYGALIDAKSRDLERIAGEVVAIARAERTVSDYGSVEILLDDLIAGVLEDTRPILEGAGLKPVVRFGEPIPVIAADPALLRRALRNLVENACKYAAGGQQLTMECRSRHDGSVEIVVEDRGPGIASSDLDLVFEPFYRGEAVRGGKPGGIGLGLALVKKVVENHGGSVKASNAPGGGARFVLSFPGRG